MTRITQQRTRQALLVTGDPLDPYLVPEKLQLFNELGEPLSLGGGFSRNEVTKTTAVLATGGVEKSTVTFNPSARLYKIRTNRPARVRLYPTAGMRDADVVRSIGVKPLGNHGRLLEVITAVNMLELILSPEVDITSVDPFVADFHYSVTNLDAASGAVAVTYSYFRTE